MQFSQEAPVQSSVPCFDVSRLYNMSPWSSFWYHHWQLVWSARQSGSGRLLPPVSSLLRAPDASATDGVERVGAVGTSTATQCHARDIANELGDMTLGDSSFGSLSSRDLSPGNVSPGNLPGNMFDSFDSRSYASANFASGKYAPDSYASDSFTSDSFTSDSHTLGSFASDSFTSTSDSFTSDSFTSDSFTSDSFTSDSFTSDSFTSDSFTSDSFTSANIPLQTGSEIELQHNVPQTYLPGPSDFSDATPSPAQTADEIDNRTRALAATLHRDDSFSAYLDAEMMKMTPTDHVNLRELSLSIPLIGSDAHHNTQTWPLTSGSPRNTEVLPEDRGGVACGVRFPHSASHQPDLTYSPAQNGSAPLFQPLELGTVGVDKQPAQPSPVLLASEDEVSREEGAPSSLLPALPARRIVEPATFPLATTPVARSGPLPSLHSLDLLICGARSASGTPRASSAPSTPNASSATGAPGAPAFPAVLSPHSEPTSQEQDLAEEESALLSRMTDEDHSHWNMLREEDQSLLALRARGMRWA